jgi:NADPH-dependent 2,4-dienoyl-CoA reductase/sulfur reductase-like enzyme
MIESSVTPAGSADVLIVGAGPAGIAAACAAAEAGRRVVVLDDNPEPGGQIWRGGRAQGASSAAATWFERLAASGARVEQATTVIDALPDGSLVTRSPHGIRGWRAETIILATGARERFIPFPGWTLPGVVGAGGLQALVKQGLEIAGKRIVIAGSGPLLLAVADLVVRKGARLVAVAEQAPLGRLSRFVPTLLGHPGKLAQAIGIRSRIGGVLRAGSFPERVALDRDGFVVSFVSGPAGRERRWEDRCDVLACGFGLVPNLEVARLLGCDVAAGRIVVDPLGHTTVPRVLAAGEGTGVGGVEKSLVEGRIAGLVAAGRTDAAQPLIAARRRAEQFSTALDRTFVLDPRLARLADDATLVCRCEDVAAGRLRCHGSWREAKLMTRIGMGPCQGRVCGPAAEQLFGWSHTDVRPPLMPVPVADLSRATNCPAESHHRLPPVPQVSPGPSVC